LENFLGDTIFDLASLSQLVLQYHEPPHHGWPFYFEAEKLIARRHGVD
jgi:hypothetical protein